MSVSVMRRFPSRIAFATPAEPRHAAAFSALSSPLAAVSLAAFAIRRYVSARSIARRWRDHQGEGSMTSLSRRPVGGIA